MNAERTHRCPVPGCDTTVTEPIHQLPAGPVAPDFLRTFLLAVEEASVTAHKEMNAHVATHYMPGDVGRRVELVTINALTDADGMPGWGLGPDVALLVLVTGEGMCQIIGRPDLDGHAAAHALMVAAQEVHQQATGRKVFTLPCTAGLDQSDT